MILFFNHYGKLVFYLGLLVALIFLFITKNPSATTLVLGVSWFVLGLRLRGKREDGSQGSLPACFFIPMPVIAIPVILMGLFSFYMDDQLASNEKDSRRYSLHEDEKSLKNGTAGGDSELSQLIRKHVLLTSKSGSSLHVFTKTNDRAVLILIEELDLRNYSNDERKKMLTSVSGLIETHFRPVTKEIYIGIKGMLFYGAMKSPLGGIETGTRVSEQNLLEFYGPKPIPVQYQ